jgi:phosphoglycolate phosphatase
VLELVALDIAGTTVEEGGAVYRVLSEVVRAAGAPDDVDVRPWMGADKRDAIAGLLGLEVGDPVVEKAYGEFHAQLTAAYAATPPRPFDGVPEAFEQLRAAGVKVALTTGFDRSITDPLLAAIGWRVGAQLDAVVCAEEVEAGRPGPFMVRRAMELTGVTDPAAVLVAGDTVLDVQSGLNAQAGIVVAVLTGAQTEEELRAAGPTVVLPGVREIPAAVLAS